MDDSSPSESFLSLECTSEGQYREKGSRFLAFARPVDDEEEVKRILEEYKKRYFDARHHCYAYRLGQRAERYRAYDDGEPAHSAGDPILGQLRSRQLSQAMVVVVRYFGGTKLGVPGLVNAYRTAAAAALDANRIVERHVEEAIRLAFPYGELSRVMHWARELDLRVEEPEYGDRCRLLLRGRPSAAGRLREMLAGQTSIIILP